MKDDIITNISNIMATIKNGGMREIDDLPPEYPAWVIHLNGKIGVAIKCHLEDSYSASFSTIQLQYYEELQFRDVGDSYLVLYVNKKDITNSELRGFANICYGFVMPGNNGEERKKIIASPDEWWESMKTLVGNKASENNITSLVGELVAYRYLLKNGIKVEWKGHKGSRVDLISDNMNVEVKTTVKRYENEITVHGQYQLLQEGKILKLYFCRLEAEDPLGESVDDIIKELISLGADSFELENTMEKKGFKSGVKERKIKYKIMELRSYDVDDSFPQITDQSFKNNEMPKGILRIQYTVDLSNLPYEKLL